MNKSFEVENLNGLRFGSISEQLIVCDGGACELGSFSEGASLLDVGLGVEGLEEGEEAPKVLEVLKRGDGGDGTVGIGRDIGVLERFFKADVFEMVAEVDLDVVSGQKRDFCVRKKAFQVTEMEGCSVKGGAFDLENGLRRETGQVVLVEFEDGGIVTAGVKEEIKIVFVEVKLEWDELSGACGGCVGGLRGGHVEN